MDLAMMGKVFSSIFKSLENTQHPCCLWLCMAIVRRLTAGFALRGSAIKNVDKNVMASPTPPHLR